MILDTSAVLTILFRESAHAPLVAALDAAQEVGIGAPTLVETGMLLTARLGVLGTTLLSRFVTEASVDTVRFDDEHWRRAVEAFRRYGKGRHPAALNFGDCLTYAVAQQARRPLLCVGSDFRRTDLELVPWDAQA